MADDMEIGYQDRKLAEESVANREQPSFTNDAGEEARRDVLNNELQMATELVDVSDKIIDTLKSEDKDIFLPKPQDTIDIEGDYEPDELVNQFVGTKEFLQLSPDVQAKLMASFGIKGLNPKSNLYNQSMHALPAFMLKGNTKYIGNLVKNIAKSGAIEGADKKVPQAFKTAESMPGGEPAPPLKQLMNEGFVESEEEVMQEELKNMIPK